MMVKLKELINNMNSRRYYLLLLLLIIPIVSAGPVPLQDIELSFKIYQENARIYFISVGEFEQNNFTFSNHYKNIKNNYSYFKQECRKENTFYETIYKMDNEEKKHKGCTINGTYQEEYCFKTITDNTNCQDLITYKIENNKLTFGSYYNSVMWDIKRADFYKHFEAQYCEIKNNTCNIVIHKNSKPYNPYIIIFENESQIFFSDRINITELNMFYNESIFPNDEINYHVEKKIELIVNEFEIKDDKLTIKLEKMNLGKNEGFFKRIIKWIKQIIE